MATIYTVYQGDVLPVPTAGLARVADFVKKAKAEFKSESNTIIRGGVNAYSITDESRKELKHTGKLADAQKEELDPLEPLDPAPFAGGAKVILLELQRPPVSAELAALQAPAGVGGASGGGPGAAPAVAAPDRSVTEAVGFTFEGEAREAFRNVVWDMSPWMEDASDVLGRKLNSGRLGHDADLACYVKEKEGAAGKVAAASVPGSGVRVLDPDLAGGLLQPSPPVPIAAGEVFSERQANRKGPHKYLLVEAYSGEDKKRRKGKLSQLESLLDFTLRRWTDRTGAAARPDVTSIIAAAGLVFSAGDSPEAGDRRVVLEDACAMVLRCAEKRPLVKRMIQAGRFFVMVLDMSQMPKTCHERAVESKLGRMEKLLETIHEELVELRAQRKDE